MAKTWAEVSASPQYKALTPNQKESARQQYFADVVAPQIADPEQVRQARVQFDMQTATGWNKPVSGGALVKPDGTPVTVGDRERLRIKAENDRIANPTNGMSGVDRVRAGFAANFHTLGQGAKQAATDYGVRLSDQVGAGLETVGLGSASKAVARNVGIPLRQEQSKQQATVDETRRINAPLNNTAGGIGGNVVAGLTQLVLPGVALRGTVAGSAFLPRTIPGNVAQGVVYGGVQPVATGESRVRNAGLAGLVSALPAVVPKSVRAVDDAIHPNQVATREAVRTIQREAQSPNVGMVPSPSQVPGATRSLFDETQNAGIARLETQSRSGQGSGWVNRDHVNNLARSNAIAGIAGDDVAMRAAEAERSRVTSGLREQALAPKPEASQNVLRTSLGLPEVGRVDVQPVRGLLSSIVAANGGRGAVQDSMRYVAGELEKAGSSPGGLYNVRKTIGDLMEGRLGSDKSFAKAATAELMQVRNAIDEQLSAYSPQWQQYLAAFQDLSKPINRMQLGQHLLDSGAGPIRNPTTGAYQLLPGKFGAQVKDLDDAAAKATGFDKAKAADILSPQDMATIHAVDDDIARSAQRIPYGSGGGSHTASQLSLRDRVSAVTGAAAESLPIVGGAIKIGRAYLKQQNAERLAGALERVLQNPAEYRRVAAQLSQQDQRLLERTLIRIGATSGQAVVPVVNTALAE